MKTLQQCADIIAAINDDAHDLAWDSWEDAGEDEELREDASLEQQEHFRTLFLQLDVETQSECLYYREHDENFREDFESFGGGESQWPRFVIPAVEAGADINAGDGGYQIGTEEQYRNAVRQRCDALVISLVGEAAAGVWWTGYNKAFEMTPEEMWSQDFRNVHNYLMHHAFVGGGS